MWEKKKLLLTRNFLFFPQCFLHNQKIVSLLVNIFDILTLFAAKLEEPNIYMWGKKLKIESQGQKNPK